MTKLKNEESIILFPLNFSAKRRKPRGAFSLNMAVANETIERFSFSKGIESAVVPTAAKHSAKAKSKSSICIYSIKACDNLKATPAPANSAKG